MKSAKQARRDAADLWRFCLVNGALDEARVRKVVDHLVDSGRGGGPAVLAQFLRRLRLDVARRTARVVTAVPLEAEARAALESSLRQKYGPSVTTTYSVDPSLIGGMRVQVGSEVYDGSVKAGLSALERRF